MAEQNNIPERDLLLARSIGEALKAGVTFDELDDELIPRLLAYKNSEPELIDEALSDRIWEQIKSQTELKPKAHVISFKPKSMPYQWAVAAVILIAAFIGFYWFLLPQTPALVAQSGDSVETFTLDDGSQVTLRPYSELYKIAVNESQRGYLLTGEGFFDITTDQNRPFSVEAGDASVTVLGTRFNLSSWGSKTQVYLEEGSIRFAADTVEVLLKPGQQSLFANGTLIAPETADADEFMDWMSNTLVFNNSNPEDVAAEIGQHYNVSIYIDRLSDRNTLDGTLRLESLSQTLDDLGIVLDGTFRAVSKNEYIFIPLE